MATPIRMRPSGVRYVLREHTKIIPIVDAFGDEIAQRAGPGFIAIRRVQRRRRYGNTIRTHTHEARVAQATDNRLMRATLQTKR